MTSKAVLLLKKRKRKGKMQIKVDTKKGKVRDERAVEMVDRISELPEHILHHILCLLHWPKDIARTSILSKKWKLICETFASFDFDQRHFEAEKGLENWNFLQPLPVEKQSAIFKLFNEDYSALQLVPKPCIWNFTLFVENSLATRLELLPSIQRFRLHVSYFDSFELAPFMNHWISAATDKNVKELEIHVNSTSECYILPQIVLSSKTLTSLKIWGCRVNGSAAIKLQNLRELSLKMMTINENMVHNFVQGCPLIEDVRLVYCRGLKCLDVSALRKLNRFEVHEGSSLRWIKLKALNLEAFLFYGKKSSRCKINLAGCSNLKNLTFRHAHMTDKVFQEHISNLQFLEKLVLLECHALQRITILSDKLKKLVLLRGCRLKEANIDAPNLLSFDFTGVGLPFSSMKVSRLQEVKLQFKSQKKQKQKRCPLELRKFLEGFDSNGFKMLLASKQVVTIHEELRGINLPPSEVYKIELTKSSKVLGNLLDSYLRCFHPKTLMLKASTSSDLLVFIHEMIMNRDKTPRCCKYNSKKCWRHYLEDVIESSDASSAVTHDISFELKWRAADWLLPEDVEPKGTDDFGVHKDIELLDINM